MRHFPLALSAIVLICLTFLPLAGRAADRERIEAFLSTTGFDVALDSIAHSAAAAPGMVGHTPEDFGADWERLAGEVFAPAVMREFAMGVLEQALSDEMLYHAAAFYASDLGQRFVAAENALHAEPPSAERMQRGMELFADMVARDPERLAIYKRMLAAYNSTEHSTRALIEIQTRFLVAASAAGVTEAPIDEEGLRALMQRREAELQLILAQNALITSALTYAPFNHDDLRAYAEALEHPTMRQVYDLLGAVQFQIMADRFEVLGTRMAELHPAEEL